jgi:predicted lactoylglutathione lyase
MESQFWLNLPSKDLNKAKEFFTKIGFKINERHSSPQMLGLLMGQNQIALNIFPEEIFKSFTRHTITNTKDSAEVLFSIAAANPAEVDAMAKKAVAAGGTLYAEPGEKDGWMYGCGFTDLDGHRWNVLFMDMSKMPK